MFESASPSSIRLSHLICGYNSHMWWSEHPTTTPPNVTHELASDHYNQEDGQSWASRRCHHLYGKQTREGRFLFGGDRRVHPFQPVGYAHPLPRLVEDMHNSCFDYAQAVLKPGTIGQICRRWGGIMPFSDDGRPIIGQLFSADDSNMSPPRLPPLWCVTGLGGSGFMRGAMAGALLAELISGKTKARRRRARALLSAACPSRFLSTEQQPSGA